MGSRKAFTLVELLVVIAILALLLSLLIPSLQRAKVITRSVNCRSNLHQMQTAMMQYVQTYKCKIFQYNLTYNTFWVNHLRRFYSSMDKVRVCPSAAVEGLGVGSWRSSWTGKYSPGSWMNNGTEYIYGSYAFNGWLHPNPGRAPAEYYFGDTQKIQVPSMVPVFSDSNWVDGWLDHTDPTPPDLLGSTTVPMSARFILKRHGRSVNAALFDGSAVNIDVSNVYNYQWSLGFQVGTTLLLPPDDESDVGG